MLPPFRIRNLRRSASDLPRARQGSADTANTYDSIVRIAAPDYDTTVAQHPEAILKYFDEVDCDIITVGTSLELAQRLEDPLPGLPGTLQTHHTFDIGHGILPMKIWQAYEQVETVDEHKMILSDRSNQHTTLERAIEEARSRPTAANQIFECNYNAEIHEDDKYRQRYIQACNPPRLDKVVDRQEPTEQIQASKLTLADLLNNDTQSCNLTTSSSLTNEGKRQAQVAGDRLRAIASPSRYSRKIPGSTEADSAHIRWASYGRSTSPFLVKQLATPKSQTQSHRDSARQPQSAGDKLRGRNRIRHCKSAQVLADHGISKIRSPRAGRFEGSNTAPNEAEATSTTPAKSRIGSPRSHLQIFESELALAKDSPGQPALNKMRRVRPRTTLGDSDTSGRNLTLDGPASQFSKPCKKPSERAEYHSLLAEISSEEPDVCRSIRCTVDSIGKVMQGLQSQASDSRQEQFCQQANQALQLGLSAALRGFDKCVRNISDTVQSALAGRACNTGELLELLDNLRSATSEPFTPASPDIGSPEGIGKEGPKMDSTPPQPSELAPLEAPACKLPSPLRLERLDAGPNNKPTINDLQSSSKNGNKLEKTAPADMLPPLIEITRSTKIEDLPQCPRLVESDRDALVKEARFPPLPTMEALVLSTDEASPSSKSNVGVDNEACVSCQPSVTAAGAPTRSLRKAESSGQFFNRMTGRGKDDTNLNRSCDPTYRATLEPRHTDGKRRNVTTDGLSANTDSSSRRPYSHTFSGSGRMPWDSFLQPEEALQLSQGSGAQGSRIRSQCASREEMSYRRRGPAADIDYAVEHHDAATVRKVQECVQQLQTLGFCSSDTDGLRRLIVYAQAADGDLLTAIDMIDEEQQAYRQRH